MARKLPAKDVVIIGLGWTGSILAYELAKAGLDLVAIEPGPWRDTAADFAPATTQDELRYGIRLDLFLRPGQDTLTFRNNMSETALQMRNFPVFFPAMASAAPACTGTARPGASCRRISSSEAISSSATARLCFRLT
jgi:choline dehydrogenase-like flavoprotein